jgi:hypothetical protein
MEEIPMAISFELPPNIEEQVRTNGADINREAKVAYLLDLYRQDRISHAQLREALDISFHEAETLIKEHGAGHDISVEEFEAERELLRKDRQR